jgi:hypothetical protein
MAFALMLFPTVATVDLEPRNLLITWGSLPIADAQAGSKHQLRDSGTEQE